MNRFRWVSLFLLVGLLLAGGMVSYAQKAVEHPAPDIDGNVWLNSTQQEKMAFLYGVGSAVALEYHIRDKHAEEPSRFVKGWVGAFQNVSWSDLATRVDNYYIHHPDQKNRHVFEVIWREIITPEWKG